MPGGVTGACTTGVVGSASAAFAGDDIAQYVPRTPAGHEATPHEDRAHNEKHGLAAAASRLSGVRRAVQSAVTDDSLSDAAADLRMIGLYESWTDDSISGRARIREQKLEEIGRQEQYAAERRFAMQRYEQQVRDAREYERAEPEEQEEYEEEKETDISRLTRQRYGQSVMNARVKERAALEQPESHEEQKETDIARAAPVAMVCDEESTDEPELPKRAQANSVDHQQQQEQPRGTTCKQSIRRVLSCLFYCFALHTR